MQRHKHIRQVNIITATDGYKLLHHLQMPSKLRRSSYYGEPRIGGKYKKVTVAGLKYICALLEGSPATMEDWLEADEVLSNYIAGEHEGWNKEGWLAIIKEFGGKLPIEIKVAPEGLIVPEGNVIYTVEATDDRFGWLPGHVEGLILQYAWFGTTVATHSRACLEVIHEYMVKTSDRMEKLDFMLNDFGFRGASSYESGAVGGYAATLNSNGTDTLSAVMLVRHLFPDFTGLAGYTIPAREHSTTTIYGTSLKGDKLAYTNSIQKFGGGLYACVMDSVDYKASVKMVGTELKRDILAGGGCFVGRPDSGNAIDNIMFALKQFGKDFGFTRNSKGYKVLHPSVAIIQGDGLEKPSDFRDILNWMEANGWAACNVAFGMGGGLLQKVDRDWQRFAQKMCAAELEAGWVDVFKATPGKESRGGRQMLYWDSVNALFFSDVIEVYKGSSTIHEVLFTGFLNGVDTHEQTYEDAVLGANSWK